MLFSEWTITCGWFLMLPRIQLYKINIYLFHMGEKVQKSLKIHENFEIVNLKGWNGERKLFRHSKLSVAADD